MSIYKPTNCRPFADAVDITKSFLRIYMDRSDPEDPVWEVPQPSGAYLTCKLETSNTRVIGYRVRLYENDRLIFSGAKVSPISELPKFEDDPTVNSGINGTYLAVPFFQPYKFKERDLFLSESYNAVYCSGDWDNDSNESASGVVADYVLAGSIIANGEQLVQDAADDPGNGIWNDRDSSHPGRYLVYDQGALPLINGGCQITDEDTVLVWWNEENIFGLYALGEYDGQPALVRYSDESFFPGDGIEGPLYIRKGKYCGFYDRRDPGGLVDLGWSNSFQYYANESGSMAFLPLSSDLENNQFSWEIELYQGPEDYASFVHEDDGNPHLPYLAVDSLRSAYYDMRVASGTILGTCAKRLHMGSTVDMDGQRRLPGYGLTSPLVLMGTFCEVNSLNGKLIPSFPIASFDSSLGIAYPKDGYINAQTFVKYGPTSDGTQVITPTVSFYKYSSDMENTLSNEKVQVCYNNLLDTELDPREVLVPNAIIDGVCLDSGDRVLWNTRFDDGKQNGIWVVSNNASLPASRPADGNTWGDYIGKVSLVMEGSYAGVVMESTATAGSFELGNSALFFRRQLPILLFEGSISGTIDELIPELSLQSYLRFDFGSQRVYQLPLPIATGTQTLGVDLGVFPTENQRLKDIQGVPRGGTPPTHTPPAGCKWVKVGMVGYTPQDVQDVYAACLEQTAPPEEGFDPIAYDCRVTSGYYGGSYQVFTREYDLSAQEWRTGVWQISPTAYSAELLFNDQEHTYVTPSSAIMENMYLKLRNGGMAEADPPVDWLKILGFDKTFNRITHEHLTTPISAEEDAAKTPPTPYKYDVFSVYRASDVNGFRFAPALTPAIRQTAYAVGPVITTGYEADFVADAFAPVCETWREGRWELASIDGKVLQDTGWFQSGTTDCQFLGLEENSEYVASFYTKDRWGRTSVASVGLSASGYPTTPYPATLKATPDCSTQSVLLEYIPENEQEGIVEGSYDVYRREYADFAMEGCPYYMGTLPVSEGQWYGEWTPVAIGVTDFSVRDFNVKQGHSYQYAIFPRHTARFLVNSADVVEFRYKMTDGSSDIYDTEQEADDKLPLGAHFVYRIGEDVLGIPYIFNICREGEDEHPVADQTQGDMYTYVGPFEFNGTVYDKWLQIGRGVSTYVLTNRVVASYAPAIANGGNPVYTQWSDWSLVELRDVNVDALFADQKRHPAVQTAYEADVDNVWLFKYGVEEGSQTINLSKSEFNSMGEFPRYFSGELNAESGDVSCWLGSEIAKGSRLGYVERRRRAIFQPLATNEAVSMLADWRKIVKSGNPKLLRDRKGRSWIVQITASSSTTQGTYTGCPTKISFSWKQIGDPAKATIVYGNGSELDKVGESGVWKPIIVRNDN